MAPMQFRELINHRTGAALVTPSPRRLWDLSVGSGAVSLVERRGPRCGVQGGEGRTCSSGATSSALERTTNSDFLKQLGCRSALQYRVEGEDCVDYTTWSRAGLAGLMIVPASIWITA